MQSLIDQIAASAGIAPTAASEGVRTVLDFLAARSDAESFQAFVATLPGAADFLANTPASAGGYGGLPAMFAGMRLVKNLRETSIPAESLLPFARAVFAQFESLAGGELWTRVLGDNQKLLAMVLR